MSRVEIYTGPSGPDEDGEDFTADTFLEFLRRSHSHWYSDDNVTEQEWVYRGHWDASWRLVPSAVRQDPGTDENSSHLAPLITKRLKSWEGIDGYLEADFEIQKNVAATIVGYADAMNSFMSLGNDMGRISVPAWGKLFSSGLPEGVNIASLIDSIFGSYGKHSSRRKMGVDFPGNECPNVALAQHHGVPTFLLDWTKNPWVAAFFSTNSSREIAAAKDVCVWALNIHQVSNRPNTVGHHASIAKIGSVGVNAPPKAGNDYLSSQQGILTYLKNDVGLWERSGNYPSLGEVIMGWTKKGMEQKLYAQHPSQRENHQRVIERHFEDENPLLRKIILKKECLPQLRRLLRRENITKAHLMPTMDNIAATSLRHAADD